MLRHCMERDQGRKGDQKKRVKSWDEQNTHNAHARRGAKTLLSRSRSSAACWLRNGEERVWVEGRKSKVHLSLSLSPQKPSQESAKFWVRPQQPLLLMLLHVTAIVVHRTLFLWARRRGGTTKLTASLDPSLPLPLHLCLSMTWASLFLWLLPLASRSSNCSSSRATDWLSVWRK